MARKRMIDPSIWQDEGMAELTPRQQLLYIGLFSNADDEGRLKASPSAIRLALPTLYAGLGLEEVADDLDAVRATMTQVVAYCVDGRHYLSFSNYPTWQRIDKPSKSVLPPPPANPEDSPNPPRTIVEPSESVRPEQKRTEEKGTEEKGTESARGARVATDPEPEPVPLARASNRRHEQTFEAFWRVWPKREGKAKALAAWLKLKPNPDTIQAILDAIPQHQVAKNWARESWRYCPLPATWLNERRWEDELPEVSDEANGRDRQGRSNRSEYQASRLAVGAAGSHGPGGTDSWASPPLRTGRGD